MLPTTKQSNAHSSWQQHPQWISTSGPPPYLGVLGQPVIVPQQLQVASQLPPYNQTTQMLYQQHHLQSMNVQSYPAVKQRLPPVITPQHQQLSTLTTSQLALSPDHSHVFNIAGDEATSQLQSIRRILPPSDGIESVSGPSHLFPHLPPLLSLSALSLTRCDDQPEDQQQQQGK